MLNNLAFMEGPNVVVLQGRDVAKLQAELAELIQSRPRPPQSITQSQSSIPVVGSKQGWETVITFTVLFAIE